MQEKLTLKPIGLVHSPYKTLEETPGSPEASEHECTVEVFEKFKEGLRDIEGFSHIYLITYLDKITEYSLQGFPPHDSKPHGVFATRGPRRPNPIGLSLVKLIERRKNVLKVGGTDLLDNTPVLDIKPFYGNLEEEIKTGWLEKVPEKKPAKKIEFEKDAKTHKI